MEIIQNYINSMFSGVPDTEDTRRLREDITANMSDKYEELIGEGKSSNEAIGAVISEFGNIDEVLAEMGISRTEKEKKAASPIRHFILENAVTFMTRAIAASLFVIILWHHFSTNWVEGFFMFDESEYVALLAAVISLGISVWLRSRASSKASTPDEELRAALMKHREKNLAVSRTARLIYAAAVAVTLLLTYFLWSPLWWQLVKLLPVLTGLYFVFGSVMRCDRELTDIRTGTAPERYTAVEWVNRFGVPCVIFAVIRQWDMLQNYDGAPETLIFMLRFVPYTAAAYVTAVSVACIIDGILPRIKKKAVK